MTQEAPAVREQRVLVVIPAYNEERSVGHVVERIRAAVPGAEVLVVDDGSSDATVSAAASAGAVVVSLPFNLGIGGARQTGCRYAMEHGHDVIVQMDADGQHPAEEIHRLLDTLVHEGADLVVGSRFVEDTGYRANLSRGLGIRIFARLLSLLCGQRLTDTTSGFRAVGRAAIINLAHTYSCDYPEVESLITLHKAGYRIVEAPVRMEPRREGRSSINLGRGLYYMLKVVLAVLVDALAEPRWTKADTQRSSPSNSSLSDCGCPSDQGD